MENHEFINSETFLEKLACLFYAIGMADKNFISEEKKKIVDMVEMGNFEDMKVEKAKEIIYSTLRELIARDEKSEQAFNVFKKFYHANKTSFSQDLKREIMIACQEIVDANQSKSKSEVILITKLSMLFQS